MPPPAIVVQNLVRRFGEVVAVNGVDMEIPAGEIYGFLGPNGAGKSTTVRILATLLTPTSGRAEVAGYDVVEQSSDVRLSIGVALQEAALDPKTPGREFLLRQARLYGLTAAEAKTRLGELTSLIDIGDALERKISTYSGGMQRRLDLAAALVHNPKVLFLDEPTTGLDPVSRAKVWEEVRRLNVDLGITIFLTTQYLEEADALADRVGIIDEGRIAAEGTPTALKREIGQDVIIAEIDGDIAGARVAVREAPGVSDVAGTDQSLTISVADGSAALTPVALALAGAGVRVERLTLREPSLDDVFLKATGARLQSEAEGESA